MKGDNMEILKKLENTLKCIIASEQKKHYEKGKKEAYHDICIRCCDFLEKEKDNLPLKQILCLCVKNSGHIPTDDIETYKVLCFSCKNLAYYETGYSELTITSEWCRCLKNKFDIERDENGHPSGIDEISENCEFFEVGEPQELGYGYNKNN